MTTARQELYDLAEDPSQDSPPKESLTKDDVVSAIHEYSTSQQKAQEEAEQNKRRETLDRQKAQEQQELQEISEQVKASLKEEMSKDKDFAKLVQTSDLPGNLVDYIAEVGDAEEAPLIIRELASNDEYQESLKRSKTQVGIKRLIGKIRRDVLTGGSQGKIPPMLQKSIPTYNPNTSPSNYDQDYYSDLAMRHGI
jgi:hypothetical protein